MSQMGNHDLEHLARRLLSGQLSPDEFRNLMPPATADLQEAQIDLDRRRRCGFPEVVFGEGKPVPVLEKIFRTLLADGVDVLATRISAEQAGQLLESMPDAQYNRVGRTLRIAAPRGSESSHNSEPKAAGHVAIITAGTSDLAVAEEARETLLWMGARVTMIFDVGVAGPHRLPEHLHKLADVHAVVVIAGMEGALPSVVGGYVACPVIAVPTSVGYGASFGGVAALLGMLNSCAANVTVVNIDAGFKGAYVAGLIARAVVAGTAAAGVPSKAPGG